MFAQSSTLRVAFFLLPFAHLGLLAQQPQLPVIDAKVVSIDDFRDFAWDKSRGRTFVTTSSSILKIDPALGKIEETFASGFSANKIAVSHKFSTFNFKEV